MRNFRQRGDALTFTNTTGAAIASGDLVVIGSVAGVAAGPLAPNEEGVMNIVGVYELPKAASEAWSFGDVVYWDDTEGVATTADGAGMRIGIAIKPVGGGASETLGEVRLDGVYNILTP